MTAEEVQTLLAKIDSRADTSVDTLIEGMGELAGASVMPPPRVRWNVVGYAARVLKTERALEELAAATARGQSSFAWRDPTFRALRAEPVLFRAALRRGPKRVGEARGFDLARLDAIGASAIILFAAGVRTSAQLLIAAGRLADRSRLAASAGLDAADLESWAHLAEIAELLTCTAVAPPAPAKESAPEKPKECNCCCCHHVSNCDDETVRALEDADVDIQARLAAVEKLLKKVETPQPVLVAPPQAAPAPWKPEDLPHKVLDHVNILYVAGVRTKGDLAKWKGKTTDLVALLNRVNKGEGVIDGDVIAAAISCAIEQAAVEADHYERVEHGEPPSKGGAGSDKDSEPAIDKPKDASKANGEKPKQ